MLFLPFDRQFCLSNEILKKLKTAKTCRKCPKMRPDWPYNDPYKALKMTLQGHENDLTRQFNDLTRPWKLPCKAGARRYMAFKWQHLRLIILLLRLLLSITLHRILLLSRTILLTFRLTFVFRRLLFVSFLVVFVFSFLLFSLIFPLAFLVIILLVAKPLQVMALKCE